MGNETLKALKKSIAKWEKNAARTSFRYVKTGIDDCPLCIMYNANANSLIPFSKTCQGCPIFQKTKKTGCWDTPYEKAENAYMEGNFTKFIKYAEKEVEFLKKLLPKEEIK